ncbi:MAG TPA: DCC1-like thiol-disulfide oxidoreductase family protein [Solirubrobacteraceae bacterium]|nr:DCC1-like thiol-disulfide oxidoreductase family protein [Solirubrobacteraceae bacterium]
MRNRWLVLYDGDCGLCKWMLARILSHDRANRLQPVALQRDEAATLLADLSTEQRMASWHLIAPTGERYSAGAALPPLLRLLPGGALPARIAAAAPGPTERGYRWVAAHRSLLSKPIPAASKRKASELVGRRESAV